MHNNFTTQGCNENSSCSISNISKICFVQSVLLEPRGFNAKMKNWSKITRVAMHIASLPSEADISTERFRHSGIPTNPTPMLTKTPSGMNVAVDWMV